MIRKSYTIDIEAPVEKTFDLMLGLSNKSSYEQWTAEFNPTSTIEGNWEQGSKMLFVGTDENGNRGGMVSRIAAHIPNEYISIEHYGILDGTNEIVEGPQVDEWAGGLENYRFEQIGTITKVRVEVDTTEGFADYFDSTYPKALQKLKGIVEAA